MRRIILAVLVSLLLTTCYADTATLKSEPNVPAEIYNFKLGKQTINGNDLDFMFPGGGDSLYLFSLGSWAGTKKDNSKLVVSLYDAQNRLLAIGESVCTGKADVPFGSIMFFSGGINKSNIQNVSYFSFAVKDCVFGISDSARGP